jgi:hypothetical protein
MKKSLQKRKPAGGGRSRVRERRIEMAEKHMVKMVVYLHRTCTRAKQEGVILMTTPKNENKELHFNYLDEIPAKIREHLKAVGLAYDIADNSDLTVIEPRTKKRRVIRKIRLGDE